MGKQIDIDAIQHTNAEVIAVGNMNVNARGDQLGPGGKVVKTRNEVMKENYKLQDRKSTRLNSSHSQQSRMPSSA